MGSNPSRSLPGDRVSAPQASVHILGLQGASVVIIDDQETARIALDQMIRGIDPNISTKLFAGGAEALVWLEHHDPDLVITDYRMPDMTGAQFTREFRKNRRHQHVPVMVVTAADDRAVRYASLEAGAVDFLAKPIDPLEVRTRCRNLLLLMHQHRLVRNYSMLQDSKLERLQVLLESLGASEATHDAADAVEGGETVTVPYDKLFAITSCVSGVKELVAAALQNIGDLEAQLAKPLRGGEE
jgi:response regulator RpfG family c-di-GMP phosphodiesterase